MNDLSIGARKKSILLVVDVRGWAYDDAAQNWKRRLRKEYEIDIIYLSDYNPISYGHGFDRVIKQIQSDYLDGSKICVKELLDINNKSIYKTFDKGPVFDHRKYDGIYFFYHRALCDARLRATPIPMKKVCVAINNEKWAKKGAAVEFADYMRGAKVLAGCNSNVINTFSKLGANIMRVSQCIDEKVFFLNRSNFVSRRTGKGFSVGWSGSEKNPIKNLPLIKAACKKSGVSLSIASDLPRSRLNEWYNGLDAVVCASSSEGGPLMLLEAGAVGIPVISTRVGLSREIIVDSKTGLFAKPTAKSISNAINILSKDRDMRKKIGSSLRKEVLTSWTYKSRLDEVRMVFEEICR